MTVSDGKCRPQTSRLKLTADTLVLQKEEFIFPDDEDGYPVDNKVNHNSDIRVYRVNNLSMKDKVISYPM